MSSCRYCEQEARNAGYCWKHYFRQYRHPLGEDEFWSFVIETLGCWRWFGPTRRGYARVSIMDQDTGEVTRHWAGHWIYEKMNGSIGEMGLVLTCGNRACVNPAHMQQRGRRAGAAMQRMW